MSAMVKRASQELGVQLTCFTDSAHTCGSRIFYTGRKKIQPNDGAMAGLNSKGRSSPRFPISCSTGCSIDMPFSTSQSLHWLFLTVARFAILNSSQLIKLSLTSSIKGWFTDLCKLSLCTL